MEITIYLSSGAFESHSNAYPQPRNETRAVNNCIVKKVEIRRSSIQHDIFG